MDKSAQANSSVFQNEHSGISTGKVEKKDSSNELDELASLIANATEAYTASIYVCDEKRERTLRLGGVHTLSRDFLSKAKISFGAGLIGWTAENRLRISVCPFEHDSTTLLCYESDQRLKSFIAVPIIDSNEQLLGVIACDSKKSYAFAKITEKILADCARIAAKIIRANISLSEIGRKKEIQKDKLTSITEQLQGFEEEEKLLSAAASIPQDIIERDAFVIVITQDSGVGQGMYYSANSENRHGHRLLETICRNKKIICGDRSVHMRPIDDAKNRSFLSVPLSMLGREIGSMNLLSKQDTSFDAVEVDAIEKIAKVTARELERIRLKTNMGSAWETTNLPSWKNFSVQAKLWFEEAKRNKTKLSLIRITLEDLSKIEDLLGVRAATSVLQKIMRTLSQVKKRPSLCSYLYGSQIVLLTEEKDVDHTIGRFVHLVEKMNPSELGLSQEPTVNIGKIISSSIKTTQANFPAEGENLNQLMATTRKSLEYYRSERSLGSIENVANWK